MRSGATDYLNKPFEEAELEIAILKALDRKKLVEENKMLREQNETLTEDYRFVASNAKMVRIKELINQIAHTDVTVFIQGESGVGKEIVARLIHKMSIRAHRPMLKVNCAALPADLLESELFGYEAGAFTGANKPKPGKFEIAHKGTILLDEIGEMSAALQAKLLHVLQDGQFSRLGGRANITADARVLAATNIDVQKAIADRRLREDLYYRLNAFTMTVPPLRERREEIPLLLMHFMSSLAQKFGKNTLPVSDRLIQECLRYSWPGNLRELGNFVKRYLVLGDENLAVEELQTKSKDGPGDPDGFTGMPSGRGGLKALVRGLKDDAEAKEIQRALEGTNWNRKLAATQLHISYKALLYKVKQHGLSPAAGKESRMRATRVI